MAITDPGATGGLVAAAAAALEGGATSIQLRSKSASASELHADATKLATLAKGSDALLIVNDRLDVALAAGAHGVHLGDDDLPLAEARRVAPPRFVIGKSVDTVVEAREAQAQGADYLGAGPVYRTGSKADTGPVMGISLLREICAAVSIPVVGIGGITVDGAADVVRAGAAGVAVIGSIMFAADPEEATRRLNGVLPDL